MKKEINPPPIEYEDPVVKMIKQLLPIVKELKKSKYKVTLEIDAYQMEELSKLGIKWEKDEE